jgi:WD40 repeat protein
LALIGGVDGVVGVYSLSQKSVVQTLKTDGPVTDATWAGDKAVVGSSTGSVKVFENGAEVASFNSHAGEVTGVAVHATGDIVASVGVDKSYVLYDLATNTVASQIFTDAGKHMFCKPLYRNIMLTVWFSFVVCQLPPRWPFDRRWWCRWTSQDLRR